MIRCILINNATSSLEEREKRAAEIRPDAAEPHVLLKTCNRVEWYWGSGLLPDHIIRHLYRVASGLESSLPGERAVQGQLKNAYQEACEKYKLSSSLHRLFQTAMHTGKRVRNETKIAEGAVSHSQATVDILKKTFPDLERKVVSIIGVNKLTEDILKFLTDRRTVTLFLSNRNFEKACALAQKYHATAVPLHDRKRLLEQTDILITATSAPHLLIHREDVAQGKELLIFDLAFPRDVDPLLAEREGVNLYDLERIEQSARTNLLLRTGEVKQAEGIIEEEIRKFRAWETHLETKIKLIKLIKQ